MTRDHLYPPAALLFFAGVFLFLLSQPVARAAVALMPPAYPNPNWSMMPYVTSSEVLVGEVQVQGHSWLRIGRPASSTNSAQVIYNAGHVDGSGNPTAHANNQLGDFSGSVILAAGNWNDVSIGLILRGQGAAFSNAASYYLAVSNWGLGLYWGAGNNFVNAGTSALQLSPLAGGASLGVLTSEVNNQYLLEFSFIGRQFEAELWKLDGEGNKTGNALAALDYTDLREQFRETGYFGLRGGRYTGTRNGYFRALEVEAIPEPSSTVLLLTPLCLGLLYRTLRRKS